MPDGVSQWLIDQSSLGVAVLFLITALVWAIRKWTDALDENAKLQKARLDDALQAAEKDKQSAKDLAVLSAQMKDAILASNQAVTAATAALLHRSGER